MRKQSSVVVLEPKKRVERKDSGEIVPSLLEATNEHLGLGLVSAPHPLDKPELRKVSTLIPATEMKSMLGPSKYPKKKYRNTTSTLLAEKSKSSQTPANVNPFVGMKQSASKANQLVDAILTEDHRWYNVPDTYQDYKAADFVMKLDTSKLELLHESIGSMEFPEDMIADTLEQEDLGDTADSIIVHAIQMRDRDKKLILEAYEKFSKYRKAQHHRLHHILDKIRDDSGYDKLEVRLQERNLQLARLERIVAQKNKFIDLIHSLGPRPSSDQIRGVIEVSVQENIQGLVSTLDDLQATIDDRIVNRKKLLNEVSRVRAAFVQKLQLSITDEDQLSALSRKEADLRTKLEQIDDDLSKIRTSNAKANETILAMDLKAASKEQALSNNRSSEEHQEMEAMKTMIVELNLQRENDLLKIQEFEKQIAEFTASPLLRMDEESDEETEEEKNVESSTEQISPTQDHKRHGSQHLNSMITKLDISDYTRQMEEIIAACLIVPPAKPLLPTEEYVPQVPEVQETPKQQEQRVALLQAAERAKLREKAANKRALVDSESSPQLETESEIEIEETVPPLDVAGYGMDLVDSQAKRLLKLIQLTDDEEVPVVHNHKRKQAEVFMVNDITEILGSQEYNDDDSDARSDDSQQSSHSYQNGTEAYKTKKQLEEAIQRRRDKLQKLKDIGKKLDKLLNKSTEKMKIEKKNRMDSYNIIIKSIAGDSKRNPRLLYHSEIEAQQLLETKQALSKEQLKWKKKLEDAMKKPEKEVLSKKLKSVSNFSQSSIMESSSFGDEEGDEEGEDGGQRSKDFASNDISLTSNDGTVDSPPQQSSATLPGTDKSTSTYVLDVEEEAPQPNPHILFQEEAVVTVPPVEILERGYSQDLMKVSISETKDGEVDVSYEPDATQKNNRLENIVQSKSKTLPPTQPNFLLPSHPLHSYLNNSHSPSAMATTTTTTTSAKVEPKEGMNSIFYTFGDLHEFIHINKIDEILRSRKKSLYLQRKNRIQEKGQADSSSIMEYSLLGTRVEIREQSREGYLQSRSRSRSRSRSPERMNSAVVDTEQSQSTHVTLDTNQVTDEIIHNLGTTTMKSQVPNISQEVKSLNSLRKQLEITKRKITYQKYSEPTRPKFITDITDESEFETSTLPSEPQQRPITFNSPRIWRGEYASPSVVNILDTINENFPTASPLITAFHAGGLKIERKVTEGVFLRSEKLPHSNSRKIQTNIHPKDGHNDDNRDDNRDDDSNISAVDLFSKSVVTRHLIGRSTWDRVVGMHSEFARSFIASRLKDTKLVFVINTAGSRPNNYTPVQPSLPLPLLTPPEYPQSYLQSQDFESYVEDLPSPTAPIVVRIPSASLVSSQTPVHVPVSATAPAPPSPQQQCDPSVSIHLPVHEPYTPKPSFSPRKKSSGVKYVPSVFRPLM